MSEFIDGFATQSGDVLVYHFDLDSGELLGKGLVYVSEGCGLSPGQTLETPPRAKKGHAVVHIDGHWQLVEDCRGTVYRIVDGRPVIHLQVGPLPDDLTLLPPPTLHHRWDGKAWELDEAVLAKSEREKTVAQAEAFLKSTDWYVIRQHETGDAIPASVLSDRQVARHLISVSREQRDV